MKQPTNLIISIVLKHLKGMGISTVTAGRILKGQKAHRNGEEEVTLMEKLDYLALAKV
jgi:alkaline phosphatase